MTSGLTTGVLDDILDHLLGNSTWTAPTDLYLALFNGDPTSGGSELSGNGYARVQHSSWNAASGGIATNDGDITFPIASGAWSEADYGALMDASTSGNLIGSGPLNPSKTMATGDRLVLPDEEVVIEFLRTS